MDTTYLSHAIDVQDVVVRYGDVTALDGVDLQVEPGQVTALLGPNGAGKTTLVDCLEGFRRPTSGTVRVLGTDPWRADTRWRNRIGVVLQDTRMDADLTVAEFVAMTRGWYADPLGVDEILSAVGLMGLADRRVHKLSGGERRRLDLGLALAGRPDLLFLDEPTTGLDPNARRELWNLLSGLRSEGHTILLTSHDMHEVEALADQVAVLIDGRIRAEGTVAQMREQSELPATVSFVSSANPARITPLGAERDERTGRWQLRTDDTTDALRRITAALGEDVMDVQLRTPTFEDVYLTLLGRKEAHS